MYKRNTHVYNIDIQKALAGISTLDPGRLFASLEMAWFFPFDFAGIAGYTASYRGN